MATVQTIKGEIEVGALGTTLMHEHVFVLDVEYMVNYPDEWGDEDAVIAAAIDTLRAARAAGVETIVDLTVLGLGRMIPWVQRVAEQVDINIIVATGYYLFQELPLKFGFRGPGTLLGGRDPLEEMFIRDITHGIGNTGVRAAVLKCATDEPGVTPAVDRVLRAVAAAHRATGTPISTHTHAGLRRGLEQVAIFKEEGVDLNRVVIGHSGDTTDLDYLQELIDEGVYIGMDRFGFDGILSFQDRVETVAKLCARGLADRMVLSHDASCHNAWIDNEVREALAPNLRFDHLFNDVLPALRTAGVTQTQLDTMLVENPVRVFNTAKRHE